MPTRPPLARGSDERLARQSGNPGGAGAGAAAGCITFNY